MDVLSVYTLLREVPTPLKPIVESHIAIISAATEFARHARHNSIAHRNLNVALGVTPPTLEAAATFAARSVERLMNLLTAVDQDVEIVIRRKPRSRKAGRISVVAA